MRHMDGYRSLPPEPPELPEPPGDDLASGTCFSEYWVRQGDALVPATREDVARIREWERARRAQWHLREWLRLEREGRRWPRPQPFDRLRSLCSALVVCITQRGRSTW
jgi:hypothetical protein